VLQCRERLELSVGSIMKLIRNSIFSMGMLIMSL
jgi:hypothetical protein